MRISLHLQSRHGRPGAILVLMIIMLIPLIGLLGIVIDSGLMMASHRHTQNAADSASLVAALYLYQGRTAAEARAAAVAHVRDEFGITETPIVNIPPSAGPYAGNLRYAEAVVGK